MAFRKLSIAVTVFVTVIILHDGIEAKDGSKKALAAEKEKLRSAGRERGSFQKLAAQYANRTADGKTNRRRGDENINKLLEMHKSQKVNLNHMMNDNEGAIAINQKTVADNDSNTFPEKMKALRKEAPTYEVVYKTSYVPQVMGVFCNFENDTQDSLGLTCNWEWNSTVSNNDLGFQVLTAADVNAMNESSQRGFRFNGPATDGDGKIDGHFLYLPLDPRMGNMVVRSPIFPGLWEFCKIEGKLHQSKMQSANIRLISETVNTNVQVVLQEFLGNNAETWMPFRFMIGKVQQEVRVMIEVTRPNAINVSQPLPHIAIDNIRMIECFPEPPVYDGECQMGQQKCNIMGKESCIKLQQICDLVKDCDDHMDEQQNCDKMPYGSYCNFEYDNCGFEDVPQPILKWTRHYGPTPTAKTGPNYDHTCGPYEVSQTKVAPPLVPAHMSSKLLKQCVGYYYYVNMNVTGPNKEKADFASIAVMKSVVFNPPPKVHGNITSKYYNCCMIRFYYQQNGKNYGSLSVESIELTTRGNIMTSLWFSTKDKGEKWYRAAIFLPNITRRYYLQFKTRMGMRIYSDSAIDDFSMAPECFGLNIDPGELGNYNYYDPDFNEQTTPHKAFSDKIYYRFTTCGAIGRYGPNQTMCDAAYNNTPTQVQVKETLPYQGIQMWEVPEEGYYTIIAMGASGGLGSAWAGVTYGSQTRALFELHKSEVIYMLVGQQGLNACKKTLSAQETQECSKRQIADKIQTYTSKTQEVRNTEIQDGGGGGGGATYVFLMDKDNNPHPLLVAAGGGGLTVGTFTDDKSQHGHGRTNDTPESGYMYGHPGQTSGAGGGWLARSGPSTPGHELVRGASLEEGGVGGMACWGIAHGGYGGGGGGCRGGGGGGGWLGGNTNLGAHGGGGYSYVDPIRSVKEFTQVTVAPHMSPGEVLIIPAIHDCGCDYRCVALNEFRSDVKCYCPSAWSTDSLDGTKCILEDDWPKISWFLIIALSIIAFICAFVILCVCLYLYNTYQRKKEAEILKKRLLEQELQLHRLRNPPGGNEGALSAFNPHYDSEGFLPQGIDVRGLPQVSRESLKLVKALGQGAFGEVYQGLYRHRTGDTIEMPVAVKTLPELSTGQAESDFLMEAAIMAKFNHPNIVHLIGVCFDRHPRFIVLELLAGGDLKNFLRESRPKPERASALTMKDLLLCSLDVCKGCKYLELKRFIHRDIAARNCLLTSRGPGRVVKIADFGMARDVYRSEYYKKGGKAMLPIKWMPPEAYIDGVFTIKTDVWSFGVLMWEVFSLGVMPYTGCANREVMEMVSGGGRLEKPYGCPQEIYRLMCECWNPTPAARPSFTQMFERLSLFLQDPEIVGAPLPVVRSLFPPAENHANENGPKILRSITRILKCSMDQQNHHSRPPTGTRRSPDSHDLQYQHLLKASQDYGNIPTVACGREGTGAGAALAEGRSGEAALLSSAADAKRTTQFLPSNSTDRLLASVEDALADEESDLESTLPPAVWETSFTERPPPPSPPPHPAQSPESGPVVDKLISITPTSPKPPDNPLSIAIEANVMDKTNHKLAPERKMAPMASPDPPRINAWPKDAPALAPKPKPLCLNAAQLEQNLNALKKNSGSVNLTTMNIVPPYINVVATNKTKNTEAKTIQIDPKKAVIHDLPQQPKDGGEQRPEGKLKQSDSAASLLNGPMTDVPYADSDNTSSSSGGNAPNHIQNIQKSMQNNYSTVKLGKSDVRNKVTKQGSNGGTVNDSEISC